MFHPSHFSNSITPRLFATHHTFDSPHPHNLSRLAKPLPPSPPTQVGLDTGVPDWIGHLRLEAPPEKIHEAVQLTEKLAAEAIPHIKISSIPEPPRRRSSFRPSLLDQVENLHIADG